MTATRFADHLDLRLRVNGVERKLGGVDARVSLLDLLRERLELTAAAPTRRSSKRSRPRQPPRTARTVRSP
jgi:hypothetical protein